VVMRQSLPRQRLTAQSAHVLSHVKAARPPHQAWQQQLPSATDFDHVVPCSIPNVAGLP